MRGLVIGMAMAGLLTGCMNTTSGEVQTAAPKASSATSSSKSASTSGADEIEAAWANREAVTYNGHPFEVAKNPNRPIAYVQAKGKNFSYTPKDVEAIARNKTGCKGKLQPGVLAFVGGYNENVDLKIVSYKNKPFRWSVDLTC